MIYNTSRQLRSLLTQRTLSCAFSTSNVYVPIRPLKQDRNVLFTIGPPRPISKISRIIVHSPFLGFVLEGLTSAWTWPVVGGTVLSLFFAAHCMKFLSFMKSHEVFELAVNKNLTKLELVIPNHYYSLGWEDAILKSRGTTFDDIFIEKLKKGTLDIPQPVMKFYRSLEEKPLKSRILTYRLRRKSIVLELDYNQIEQFRMQTFPEVRQRLIDLYRGKIKANYLENYSTEKQKRNVLTIKTRKIAGVPLFFYLNVKNNSENKYDEYLKAWAEGKTIVTI